LGRGPSNDDLRHLRHEAINRFLEMGQR